MKIHELKIWPEFFRANREGRKNFELRKNDRGFAIGDKLILKEWDPETKAYTGLWMERSVFYILAHRPDAGCAATFGLTPGYVILGLE